MKTTGLFLTSVRNAWWLLSFGIILLAGCEKDRPLESDYEIPGVFSRAKSGQAEGEGSCCAKPYWTLDDFPQLRTHILNALQLVEPEFKYYAQLLEGSVISHSGANANIYTVFWQTEGSSIFKLLVEANASGTITQMGVLQITAGAPFLANYYQGTAHLSDFVGEVRVIELEAFFRAKRSGSVKSGNRAKNYGIEDCLRLIFVNGGPVGGNGGGGVGDPGSTGFPDNRPPGTITIGPSGSGSSGGDGVCNRARCADVTLTTGAAMA